jgi:hypothetical protein
MPASFSRDVILQGERYWYERIPFVQQVALTSGATTSIVGLVSGWNQGQSPDYLVTVEDVATARDPNLAIRIVADGQTYTLYAASHPAALQPVSVQARSVDSLAITAFQLGTGTSLASPVVYSVSIFHLPLVWKVMLGYPITPEEQDMARQLGLTTSPVAQNGQHPIPLSAVIERTYLNRQYATPLAYDGPPATFGSSLTWESPTFTASTNELLVLTEVAAAISSDYSPQISVMRDSVQGAVVFDPSVTSLQRPMRMWLPALDQIQVTLTVSSPPPGPVPVRIKLLRLSLSNLLRVRLGLLSQAGLESLFSSERQAALGRALTDQELAVARQSADQFWLRIQAGVI